MDFDVTPEQREYARTVTRFATDTLNDGVGERDAASEFPYELWKRCAEFGVQGLPVPEEYGGQGADPVTIAAALEALGYGCVDNGLTFSLNAHMWSCELPIVTFGSDEQKQRYLPGLTDGSLIGVQAMTEPGSGSDAFGLATTATRAGDRFVLRGRKTFITNAPVADVFVVFATADDRGPGGISAFLVDRNTPGLSVGSAFSKMGLRTSPMAEVVFEDCEVATSSLLSEVGAGMAIFNTSIDWERAFILANGIGSMQRRLEDAIAYANERQQYGATIGSFQAVSHKLVDVKLRLDASRLFLYRLAWSRASGRRTAFDSAAAKVFISEALLTSSLDLLQVHGASGYMVESGIEREVRDAVAGRIYSGTSEVLRNVVAAGMGLGR